MQPSAIFQQDYWTILPSKILKVFALEDTLLPTNTGNVAREFFSEAKAVAKITGVDEELITRFQIILQVLTYSEAVSYCAFKEYKLDTVSKYVKLYAW